MKLGSLFDGIGGFPLSAAMCGVEPVWASEIEPFPILVTHKRFPNMKHLGNVSGVNGAEIEPVDIITFGSPCQDLSVAGKQTGIHEGARSNLFFEAVRIIKEMRQKDEATGRTGVDVRPRYAVWENVPGAFSSNGGADFKAVLQALAEVCDHDVSIPLCEKGKWQKAGCIVGNDWSIAWRVYDAKYWGVPQRRKRIYLVADFGSERAGEILFEPESLRGDSSQGGTPWERTSRNALGSADGDSKTRPIAFHLQQDPISGEISPCIGAQHQATVGVFMGGQGQKAGSIAYSEKCSPTLKACASGTNRAPDVVYALAGNAVDRDSKMNGKGWNEALAPTLNTQDRHAVVWRCLKDDVWKADDSCQTLRSRSTHDRADICIYPNVTGALCANSHPGSYTGQDAFNDMLPVIKTDRKNRKYIVRRLTPLECCRLQGYPDGWTENLAVPDPTIEEVEFFTKVWSDWAKINGKKAKNRKQVIKWLANPNSDSAEYKAYGNSLAIPCSYDVIRRITQNA